MDWHCVCSCKAGQSGFCKHVIATLLYINSCTDLTQAWGKEKKEIAKVYENSKLEEFWCYKPKKEDIESHDAIDKHNFDRLLLCNSSSGIYKFMKRKDQNVSGYILNIKYFWHFGSLRNFTFTCSLFLELCPHQLLY